MQITVIFSMQPVSLLSSIDGTINQRRQLLLQRILLAYFEFHFLSVDS